MVMQVILSSIQQSHSLHGKKLSLLCFLSCLSIFSFLVKRFWHTPQVKVLRCLFRRWCSINWLLMAKVCWQYPQECICKRQMYMYNINQTFQLHVNYLLKLHVWLTSVLSNWCVLWALSTSVHFGFWAQNENVTRRVGLHRWRHVTKIRSTSHQSAVTLYTVCLILFVSFCLSFRLSLRLFYVFLLFLFFPRTFFPILFACTFFPYNFHRTFPVLPPPRTFFSVLFRPFFPVLFIPYFLPVLFFTLFLFSVFFFITIFPYFFSVLFS